jgi:hypothetical protein
MRLSRIAILLALLSASAIAPLPGLAAAEMSFFSVDERIVVKTEATLIEGAASLALYASVKDAEVYVDRSYRGRVPYTGKTEPGSHYIEVSAPGYYPLGIWILLEEKTLYTIDFSLTRITGFLDLHVEPADASVSIDGLSYSSGVSELPVGSHRILVRRFGYAEESLDELVVEKATRFVSVTLEKAAFAVEGLGFSRKVFNPRNSGAPGSTSLEFRAATYGSAHADIFGPDGSLVASLDYPNMTSWSQSKAWNGRDASGQSLPDGLYRAELKAVPALGVPIQAEGELPGGQKIAADGSITAQASVEIDSTLVIRAIGSASALPGLLYMPDPAPEPAGTVVAEGFWFAPLSDPASSAFGLSAAIALGGKATLAIHASAETGDGSFSSGDLAGSVLIGFLGDKTTALSGAFFLRGSYSPGSSASMPGSRSGVEAALPFSANLIDLGGLDLRFALAPGAFLDLSGEPAFSALGRAALWLEGSSFRVGLSGELPFDALSGFEPLWPARLAAEGRLMLGASPFVAAAYATSDIGPTGASFGLGLGLGLLF